MYFLACNQRALCAGVDHCLQLKGKQRSAPAPPHTTHTGRGAQARDQLGSDGHEGAPGPESYQEFQHGDGRA